MKRLLVVVVAVFVSTLVIHAEEPIRTLTLGDDLQYEGQGDEIVELTLDPGIYIATWTICDPTSDEHELPGTVASAKISGLNGGSHESQITVSGAATSCELIESFNRYARRQFHFWTFLDATNESSAYSHVPTAQGATLLVSAQDDERWILRFQQVAVPAYFEARADSND